MWWAHGDLDEAEASERRYSNWEVLSKLVPTIAKSRRVLVGAFALLVFTTALQLVGPQILREVLNGALNGGTEERILWLAAAFVAVVIASFVLNFALAILVSRAGLELAASLKKQLFEHILSLELSFFTSYPPGKLLSRVESDCEQLKMLVGNQSLRLFGSLFTFVGILAVMLYEDWQTTLIVLAATPILAIGTVLFLRFIRPYHRESRQRDAEITSFVTEYVQGVDVIRHHGYGDRAREKLAELNAARIRVDARSEVYSYTFWGLFHFFEIAAVAAIIAVGAPKAARGEMDIGTLVLFIEYLRQVFMPLLMLSEFVNFVQRALVSAERVFGILSLEPETAKLLPGAAETASGTIPFHSSVRFENVGYSYDGERQVLSEVDFEIRRGERVALVGPSGGGKTTIANLLMSFLTPSSGRILVDDQDLRSVRQDNWRRNIGLVLQQLHLFPGSLRDNLTVFHPEISDGEILKALAIVQGESIPARLERGLDSMLTEGGANLSQGERQLVSFARALIHNPPILILDEATASVDPVTERAIQLGLERALSGRTALIIAHRLATITEADKILVIEQGRILESGSHDELYAKDGVYKALFDLQFASAEEPK